MHHAALLSCFVVGYTLALALELLNLRINRPTLRLLALAAGLTGFVAHTTYIALFASQMPLILQLRWMLYLAWILVIFYLCGEFRQNRLPYGIFVLPVVLVFVGIGVAYPAPEDATDLTRLSGVWGPLHGVLILLAAVGVCIGFVASVMYLIQARRLRSKTLPLGRGMKLLSLERLETMNRRALLLSFPMLTAGMIAGVVMMFDAQVRLSWADPRVIGTMILWLVFALVLYLRYAQHVRGRQAALWTIVAFLMLLGCLALSHLPQQGE